MSQMNLILNKQIYFKIKQGIKDNEDAKYKDDDGAKRKI